MYMTSVLKAKVEPFSPKVLTGIYSNKNFSPTQRRRLVRAVTVPTVEPNWPLILEGF